MNNGEEKRGTGFYGIRHGCREIVENIPECFRIVDKGHPIQGTGLTVVGFQADIEEWRGKIVDSVLASFFYAIDNGKLRITLEPDDHSDDDEIEINRETLDKWFRIRLSDGKSSGDDSERSAVRNALNYRKIATGGFVEKQDPDLGHCRLWIRVDDKEDLPNSVALVRRTGMLVTDRQKGLERFRSHRNFSALCVFEDPEGNNLLRRMENERHDQFEPDRLPVADRQRGHRALGRIVRWIREEIRKVAGPAKEGRQATLDELASYLPLYGDHEDVFDSKEVEGEPGWREHGFGERITVKLKPVRRSAPSSLPTEGADGGEEGDGPDTGHAGGGGIGDGGGSGGGGPGEGEGTGGTGGKGGGTKQRGVSVSRVRILPIRGRRNCYRLSFEADFDGVVGLTLEEAGDSTAIAGC